MALSKASCTGRGLIPAIGGHVHRMFDESEDDLFSLSLDDVMDDRPWTADELMGGGARPSNPNPALAPKTASAPTPAQSPVSTPAPTPAPTSAPTPLPARQAHRPRRRHFSLQRRRANRPTAPLCTAPSSCLFLRHASLRSQGSMSPLPLRLPTIPGLQPIWMRPLPACRRSMFQLTRFLPPTRAPRTMRAARHIPIIPMAMLATVASRPRIMAPHRAIIPTIRTLPRPHRNMTRRPRPRRRIPKARRRALRRLLRRGKGAAFLGISAGSQGCLYRHYHCPARRHCV